MSLKIQTFGFYPAQLRNTEHQLMDFRRLRLYRQAALSEQEHGAYIPGQHTLLLFQTDSNPYKQKLLILGHFQIR